MDAPSVALSALLGLVVGWFVVVRVVERIPEPSPLPRRAQIAVAIVNSALWAVDTNKFATWWAIVPYGFVFSVLLAVSVVDLRIYRIPDRIVFPSLLAAGALLTAGAVRLHNPSWMKYALVGLAAYFTILFLFHIVSPRGMGFGDVKLALLMGLSLGWLGGSALNALYLVLIALFLGCILGIAFGLAMRLIKGRGGAFPFGPALALATVYVILTFEKYLVTL